MELETFTQKLKRKCAQEPLIPIGAIVTTLCLIGASRTYKSHDKALQLKFYRGRVAAQYFTLGVLLFGGMSTDLFKNLTGSASDEKDH